MIDDVNGVFNVHWNPRRNKFPFPLNRLPIGPRVNNFGDLLGPMIVRRMVERANMMTSGRRRRERLLSVGSIMSLAADGDVIWGTGVNGKTADADYSFVHLDVRALRGPLTREFLQRRGIESPEVYGDPALLIPELFPEWATAATMKKRRVGVVPNFHDLSSMREHPGLISPLRSPREVITDILQSETIIASSLHGVILAEAFGIPAVALASRVEPPFKYHDYYQGTGRVGVPLVEDFATAEEISHDVPWARLEEAWSPRLLLEAFPSDMWSAAVA